MPNKRLVGQNIFCTQSPMNAWSTAKFWTITQDTWSYNKKILKTIIINYNKLLLQIFTKLDWPECFLRGPQLPAWHETPPWPLQIGQPEMETLQAETFPAVGNPESCHVKIRLQLKREIERERRSWLGGLKLV